MKCANLIKTIAHR